MILRISLPGRAFQFPHLDHDHDGSKNPDEIAPVFQKAYFQPIGWIAKAHEFFPKSRYLLGRRECV
jgi:hypothetical protein